MNIHSIHTSTSPFQFLARQANQLNHDRVTENKGAQRFSPEINQPALTNRHEKIIENQLINGIQKVLGADSISLTKLDVSDFTPEKVADRILAFVNKAAGQLKNADPNFDQDTFFSQVKQGIETGFSQARDALDHLGVLNGQTKQNLDDTYSKIQEGLSKLESADQTTSSSLTQVQGFSAQINQAAQIEIITKEGDVIKIRLAQSASVDKSAASSEQNGTSVSAFQSNAASSSSFSVTVDGNLNEGEQNSLKKLLNQMDKVGQDFFNGNIQSAFKHAQHIGLDTQQIASFSMNLSMEKSIQAVAAYQQVGLPDQKIEPAQIKQAADFFSQARDLLKTAQSALEPFENPKLAFNDLFNAVQQVGIEKNTETTADILPLQHIIQPLTEAVFQNVKTIQV
ncbi:MAG: DUF5610 domain-containing protein [Methylococcaceae bacterium]